LRRETLLLRRREATTGLWGLSRARHLWSGIPEHRLRRLRRTTGLTRLHRRHRSTARSTRRCVHQHRRAAIRARPCWSRHSGSPVLSSGNGIPRITRPQRSDDLYVLDDLTG
jgi:hypothetical protein